MVESNEPKGAGAMTPNEDWLRARLLDDPDIQVFYGENDEHTELEPIIQTIDELRAALAQVTRERDEAIRELGKYAHEAGALATRLAMLREAAARCREAQIDNEGMPYPCDAETNDRVLAVANECGSAERALDALLSAQAQGGEDRTRPASPGRIE
jgi:chorismate mutase